MNPAQLLAHFDRLSEAPDAIPRIRRFILTAAIVGKLSSKPERWQHVTLADCANVYNGRAYKQHELLASGTPVIRIQNLNGGQSWYYSDLQLTPEKYCDPGDLLYAWSGTFGPYIWEGPRSIFHYHIWKLKLSSNADKRFMFYLLDHLTAAIKEESHGLMLPHMTKQKMETWPVLLPSLDEQRTIVTKLDELMGLCDRLEAAQRERESRRDRLTRASLHCLNDAIDPAEFGANARFHLNHLPHLTTRSDQIRALRQTILDLAVRGKLTDGPWQWASGKLGTFLSFLNGYAFKSSWFQKDGIRVCRNANVSHGTLDWTETARVSESHAEECDRFSLSEGDIVLSLDRPIISSGLKVAIVRKTDLPCLLLQRVAKPLFDPAEIVSEYLVLWFQSSAFTDSIDPGRSKGVPHISTNQVLALDFRLPPVAEQHRIVAKVDELMAVCDQLETQLTTAQTDSRRLLEAVLHEALAPTA